MSRGNQREKAREKNLKQQAAAVSAIRKTLIQDIETLTTM